MKKNFIKSIFFDEGFINFLKRKKSEKNLHRIKWYNIKYKSLSIKILLNPKNGYVDNYIYKKGIYEKEIIDLIVNCINKESVFLDIGANIGQHSLIISNFCKKVYAFEPLNKLYNQFNQSILKNNYKNIEVIKTGIGKEKNEAEIFIDENQSGYTTLLNHLEKIPTLRKNSQKLIKEKIIIETLDSFFKNKKVDFIKMDIEGYEYFAFLGGLETIKKNRPYIILEFSNLFYENHEEGLSLKFYNLIKEIGYKIKSIEKNIIIEKFEDIDMSKKQENFFLY